MLPNDVLQNLLEGTGVVLAPRQYLIELDARKGIIAVSIALLPMVSLLSVATLLKFFL